MCSIYINLVILLILVVVHQGYSNGVNGSDSAEEPSTSNNNKEEKPKLSKHPVILIFSYDGFRHDFFHRLSTPAFDSIAKEGLSADMSPQFPSKTFPNHHSIATGLHPESHGVIDNNAVFDPKYGKLLGGRDEDFWVFRDDVNPIWILNEWAGDGRASGVSMWPGCQFPFGSNKTLPTYLQRYNSSLPFKDRIDQVISWITNKDKPANLVLSYFEEPDGTAHAFGPDSEKVDEQIQRVDNVTNYLIGRLKELGIYDDVNLVLLSDHGFSPVMAKDVINLTSLVDTSLYKAYGKTPIYHIAPNDPNDEAQIDNVYNLFQEASNSRNFTVYKKSELEKLKPNWYFHNNRRIMPIVAVANEGVSFEDFYEEYAYYYNRTPWNHEFNPETSIYGVHGYDNSLSTAQPFFMATGPSFVKNAGNVGSFVNIDLFPLFCKIAGFGMPPNNATNNAIKLVYSDSGESAGFFQGTIGGTGMAILGIFIIAFFILIIVFVVLRLRRNRRQGTSGTLFNDSTERGQQSEQSV